MIMASSSVSKNIGSRVDIDQKREKANTLLAEAVERMQLLRNEVEKVNAFFGGRVAFLQIIVII